MMNCSAIHVVVVQSVVHHPLIHQTTFNTYQTYYHTVFLHYHFLMWDLHDPAANGFLLGCFQL